MFKIKQKSLRVLLIVTTIIVALFGTSIILLNLSFVQNGIRKRIVAELTETLHTRVEIGSLSFCPFSHFLLQNIYLEDQHRDTLLAARQISVHLDFWKLLSQKVSINSADLDQFNFNLKVDSMGKTNFDFVLKAFSSTDTTPSKMKLIFNIDRFRLNNGRFRLTNIDKSPRPGHFDATHLDFRNLRMDLSLHRFSSDTLAADIRSLSCTEKSGLILTRFQTKLRANHKRLDMVFLELKMPNSELRMKNISFRYDSLANLKHIMQKVKINCTILPSEITPHDFACFLPQLSTYNDRFHISSELSGTLANFKCKKLNIAGGNSFKFSGNFDINGLPDINETFIYANVNQFSISLAQLQDMIAHVSGKPFTLPDEVIRLGNIRFNGSLTGFFSEMVAYGNFSSRMGNLYTDIKLSFSNNLNKLLFSGSLRTTDFKLGELLNSSDLGNISLQAKLQGKSEAGKPFYTTAKATVSSITFKQYTYDNLTVDGTFDGSKFDGKASLSDPNINFDLSGLIDISKHRPEYKFSADLENFAPHKLNLVNDYPNLTISCKMAANLQGDLMKDADGTVLLNHLTIANGTKTYQLNNLTINALPSSGGNNRLDINSDLINGYCQGKFNFIKLPKDIIYIAANYLPALLHSDDKQIPLNNFTYKLTADVEQSNHLMDVLTLPIQMGKDISLEGNINVDKRQMDFILDIPDLTYQNSHFSKLRLACDNAKNMMQVSVKGMILQNDNGVMNLFASMTAAKDSVNTRLLWDNNGNETYAGEIVANTKLLKESDKLWAYTQVLPTQIVLNDSAWNIRPGSIRTDMKTVWIDRFDIERQQQYLHIEGTLSDKVSDSLVIGIQSIKLEHISKMLHLESPSLNGTVTGKINILSALNHPIMKANVFAQNFGLNHTVWGDTYAESSWDEANQRLNAVGKVLHNRDTVAYLAGGYYPAKDSMAFFGHTKQLPIDFLTPYLKTFLSKTKGYATGNIGMFVVAGKIWFDGAIDIKEGQVGLGFLNTTYSFEDTIHLSKNAIKLNDITIHDEENNKGSVTCIANHSNFKDWKYDINVTANNLMALNTKQGDDENFWGRAYANGNVHINGDDASTRITINATSKPKTEIYISVGAAESAADNSFIDYIVKNKRYDSPTSVEPVVSKTITDNNHTTIINATLNITPDAQVELILDPKSGDKIDATGSGILNIGYTLHQPGLQMRGSYTIKEGKYMFTFQNALNREFKIDNGSVIRWNGTANNAQIDINARYQVTASLADLMDADLLKNNRTSVSVNCLLNLTGNLMNPDIKFDIDLPNSSDEIKEAVKSIINTSEMMNRQMFYLLALGRFYTPDYMRTSANNMGQEELISAATSTVSNQLNNVLSQAITGVNLGFNYRHSGVGDLLGNDYEAAIMYQNNKWIINGNVGYRDDNVSTSKFIGDVDIQYLLSQSGRWRVRGYNHTNDYRQLNPAPYTQGLGLTYTESFNSFSELLKGYWRSFKSLFKKKKKT